MPTDPDNITTDAQATKTSKPAIADDARCWPKVNGIGFDPRDIARREQLFTDAIGERVNLMIDGGDESTTPIFTVMAGPEKKV